MGEKVLLRPGARIIENPDKYKRSSLGLCLVARVVQVRMLEGKNGSGRTGKAEQSSGGAAVGMWSRRCRNSYRRSQFRKVC